MRLHQKIGLSHRGFTLIEILVSLLVFGVLGATLYSAYVTQVQNTSREHSYARAAMEMEIIRTILERDISMAGYGLAQDFSTAGTPEPDYVAPARALAGTNNGSDPSVASGMPADKSDTLTLMGTALGLMSRTTQGWTASIAENQPPLTWSDSREQLQDGDRHIVLEPFAKALIVNGAKVPFVFSSSTATNQPKGSLFYGLYGVASAVDDGSTMPYYAVRYYLGGASANDPAHCAPGTVSLLRAESRKDPAPNGGDPILSCVLNMQVAFGLDSNEDDAIELWDEGGETASGLTAKDFRGQLKQVRLYLLAQTSRSAVGGSSLTPILVGDADLGTGAEVALDTDQEQYQWKLTTIHITPRNIR